MRSAWKASRSSRRSPVPEERHGFVGHPACTEMAAPPRAVAVELGEDQCARVPDRPWKSLGAGVGVLTGGSRRKPGTLRSRLAASLAISSNSTINGSSMWSRPAVSRSHDVLATPCRRARMDGVAADRRRFVPPSWFRMHRNLEAVRRGSSTGRRPRDAARRPPPSCGRRPCVLAGDGPTWHGRGGLTRTLQPHHHDRRPARRRTPMGDRPGLPPPSPTVRTSVEGLDDLLRWGRTESWMDSGRRSPSR